jgi:hypothetical protein
MTGGGWSPADLQCGQLLEYSLQARMAPAPALTLARPRAGTGDRAVETVGDPVIVKADVDLATAKGAADATSPPRSAGPGAATAPSLA